MKTSKLKLLQLSALHCLSEENNDIDGAKLYINKTVVGLDYIIDYVIGKIIALRGDYHLTEHGQGQLAQLEYIQELFYRED